MCVCVHVHMGVHARKHTMVHRGWSVGSPGCCSSPTLFEAGSVL